MSMPKRFAIASAVLAIIGAAPLAAAHGVVQAGPPLTEQQMQSSEGPTWHAGEGGIYDPAGNAGRRVGANAVIPARDGIIYPDDATNTMTPAESSRITGHVDSAAGPPRNGSEEQAGNMGPNSSKGQ